jgi:maltose O-acetyltransferase
MPVASARLRQKVLETVAPSWWLTMPVRHRVLRWCGVRLGDFIYINAGVRFISPDVVIGPHSLVNHGCVIDSGWAPIEIGAYVFIAPNVTLETATHEIGPARQRAGDERGLPVRIGDGCWLGIGCTILPGVTVGAGCMVAAGAVVVRDCDSHGLYAGVPARRLRDLPVYAD